MKYVILTNRIQGSRIGGGVSYVRNKVNFLKGKNIETTVITFSKGNDNKINFPELEEFTGNIIPELQYSPIIFSKQQVQSIINKMLKVIRPNGEVIIESLHVNVALWGELLAERINGKNFVYIIDELTNNKPLSKSKLDFFNFKHKRRELAGIAEKSLPMLFKGYKELKEYEIYKLLAVSTNVVEDYAHPIIDRIQSYDFNLASIGRLEKPYVKSMLEQIKSFAEKHVEKQIQLVLIGGITSLELERKIRNIFVGVENISLILTGALFPIPKTLFKKIDVFVSSSGSARVSYYEGVPTISIDANDYKPIGILGYTTNNTLFRKDEESNVELSVLLEKILIERFCEKNEQTKVIMKPNPNIEFQKHVDFLKSSNVMKEYFPIEIIKEKITIKFAIQSIGIKIFSVKWFNKLKMLKITIWKFCFWCKRKFQ